MVLLAKAIRAFLDVVESRLATQDHPSSTIADWLPWARGYVEDLDPLAGNGLDTLVAILDPPDEDQTDEAGYD